MKRSFQVATRLLTFLSVAGTAVANHVHLQVAWRADGLVLGIYDFEAGSFAADAYPFIIGNAGMKLIPASAAFAFLGEPGATFFALPQDENLNLPFLGIGVDNVSNGTFSGNQVNLRLTALAGPGQFALYEVNAFGQPTLRMNSRDGLSPSGDAIDLPTGAHVHLNWAFNTPGEYQLTFVAEATRVAGNQPIVTAPATYHFRVLPPPAARLALARKGVDQFTLHVNSRTGARLRLIESPDLITWATNASWLLSAPEWQTNLSASPGANYWRAEEIFP